MLDYNDIKGLFTSYLDMWKTKDLTQLKVLFSPHIFFTTSTSKTTLDGSQHSLFGIKDFIDDFPKTSDFQYEICNFACIKNENKAYTYADVFCNASNSKDEFFNFTSMIITEWEKKDSWICVKIKQEIIPGNGMLLDYFSEKWYFEKENDNRDYIIQGECDSPFNIENEIKDDSIQVLNCLSKYLYGIEHMNFQCCFECVSLNFDAYSKCSLGEGRTALLTKVKKNRLQHRYETHPLKIKSIEVVGEHAYIEAYKLLDTLPSYIDGSKQYAKSIEQIEFEKEGQNWKIVYLHSYPCIIEI